MFIPIQKSIELVGGLTAMAKLLGVKPPTVYQWKCGDRPVPIQFCKKIQMATSDEVTCKDLRPNDWQDIWPELLEATKHESADHRHISDRRTSRRSKVIK